MSARRNPRHLPKSFPRSWRARLQHSLTYAVVVLMLLALCAGLYRSGVQLANLEADRLTIHDLPYALLLSLLRMTASYVASIVVSFGLGLLAARTEVGERLIIPAINILQSVPVVGFFPAAVGFFVALGGGARLGVEAAAIFLIFTSQAWNMVFAVYEAIKTIPSDTEDAANSFGLEGYQKFIRLYAPAAVPRLLYNSILSWTNGWYFLVACEIITVGQVHYDLPGIGSFLARSAEQNRINLVLWGIVALTVLILVLDFLVWRPAMAWAERFRYESSGSASAVSESDRLDVVPQLIIDRFWRQFAPLKSAGREIARATLRPLLMGASWLIHWTYTLSGWLIEPIAVAAARLTHREAPVLGDSPHSGANRTRGVRRSFEWLPWSIGVALGVASAWVLGRFLMPPWPPIVREIPRATLYSTLRILLALAISFAWTLPVVYWCFDRPRLRKTLGTIAQIGASLPAIALFPLIILVAVRKLGGDMESASIILLLTGMQWYILFNGLGGTAIVPADLLEAGRSLGLSRYQIWRRIVLPAMRPALITGAITAFGGGWNALVVSEYIVYRGEKLSVEGLGSLLSRAVLELGDTHGAAICVTALTAWTILITTVVWRPLYQNAADRYRLEGF